MANTKNEKIINNDLSEASADNYIKFCEQNFATVDDLVTVQRKTDAEMWALGYEYCGQAELSLAEHELSAAKLYKRLLPKYREHIASWPEESVVDEYDKIENLFEQLKDDMSHDEMDAVDADAFWSKLVGKSCEKEQ